MNDRETANEGGAPSDICVDRAGVTVVVAARVAAMVPAIAALTGRRDRLTRPRCVAAAVLVVVADLVWLARRSARSTDRELAVAGVVDSAMTIAAVALAALSGDPEVAGTFAGALSMGCSATAGMLAPLPGGIAATAAVAATTGLLERRRAPRGSVVQAASSVVSFYVGGRVARGALRRHARRLETERRCREDDRRQLEELRTDLAVQRERETHNRMIHQHALQVLEMVAGKWDLSPERVKAHAEREAAFLRRALEGDDDTPHDVGAALGELARDFADLGLDVQVDGAQRCPSAEQQGRAAVLHATREALLNVLKHAGVKRATVKVSPTCANGIEVSITDAGRGFDASSPHPGLERDVYALMATVGGSAHVRSRPGEGTQVLLHLPGVETQSKH